MNIREEVAVKILDYAVEVDDDKSELTLADSEVVADSVIPLVLKAISKESSKLDHTTYFVPDYSKFRALWEEFVSGKEGE